MPASALQIQIETKDWFERSYLFYFIFALASRRVLWRIGMFPCKKIYKVNDIAYTFAVDFEGDVIAKSSQCVGITV